MKNGEPKKKRLVLEIYYSIRLFCNGVPVKTIRRAVLIFVKHLARAV